jgi:PadR family transcriptional regulator PadR
MSAAKAPPTATWLRGVLEPCLLALLADGEAYGYELTSRIEAEGIGRVAGGTLYPALLRLEEHGLVTAEWRAGQGGPGRKYYRLTADGRAELDDARHRWQSFVTAVDRLLGPARGR